MYELRQYMSTHDANKDISNSLEQWFFPVSVGCSDKRVVVLYCKYQEPNDKGEGIEPVETAEDDVVWWDS